jgi:hypothetical protein
MGGRILMRDYMRPEIESVMKVLWVAQGEKLKVKVTACE